MTAIFLVDAEKCLPSAAAWPKLWEEHEAWRKLRNAREAEDARKAAQAEKVRQPLLALWGMLDMYVLALVRWLSLPGHSRGSVLCCLMIDQLLLVLMPRPLGSSLDTSDLWPIMRTLTGFTAGSAPTCSERAQEARAKKDAERAARDAERAGKDAPAAAEGADADDKPGAGRKGEAKVEPGVKPEQANGQVRRCCPAHGVRSAPCTRRLGQCRHSHAPASFRNASVNRLSFMVCLINCLLPGVLAPVTGAALLGKLLW